MARAWVYEDPTVGWRTMVNGDLPTSGVTAATYGDGTHVAQIAVNAQGVITSASSVLITAGGSSPLTTKGDLFGHSSVDARVPVGADGQVLTADSAQTLGLKWAAVAGAGFTTFYDTTLGADTATFDTGANGVPQTASHLLIIAYLRGTESANRNGQALTFNADTGANYSLEGSRALATAVAASTALSATSISVDAPCATAAGANAFGAAALIVPHYTNAINSKSVVFIDTSMTAIASSTNNWASVKGGLWSGTAAISRITFTASGGANFKAGSRVSIYGLG